MADEPSPAAMVALRHRREATIQSLCDHFAADHLEAEELEQLIDAAHAATTVAALDALVADLPDIPPAEAASTSLAIADPELVRDHGTVLALMGGVERKGAWTPARQNYVVALMGGVDLDFREARMPPGVTELYVLALMGGVEIIVPPGLRVESSGIGIMGGFEHAAESRQSGPAAGPVLRITGAGVMGGVDIVQRLPGETARDAKRRIREERRQLRRGDEGQGT